MKGRGQTKLEDPQSRECWDLSRSKDIENGEREGTESVNATIEGFAKRISPRYEYPNLGMAKSSRRRMMGTEGNKEGMVSKPVGYKWRLIT